MGVGVSGPVSATSFLFKIKDFSYVIITPVITSNAPCPRHKQLQLSSNDVSQIGHRTADFQHDALNCTRNFKDDSGAADDSFDGCSRLLPEIATWTSPHRKFEPKSQINHTLIIVAHTDGSKFINAPRSSDGLLNAPPRCRATSSAWELNDLFPSHCGGAKHGLTLATETLWTLPRSYQITLFACLPDMHHLLCCVFLVEIPFAVDECNTINAYC
ncbi:uncharacterized protein G2W53_004106 [Senna tora]|uniref:Uncharacterized protein n=1 Tax=Senna tora TaxID=362788 RepID=A0A834X9Z8_9FABA|nr:uncharacterized protein G2W53_004106 [Senna tora]